ncbi:MAG: polyprenyl synthetase family protein [Pseudomonadota bacterium]
MSQAIDALRELVEGALQQRLPGESALAQPVLDCMRHAVLGGGKRIRPILTCAACSAFGGDAEPALDAACAVEFIHAYSLIHDDLPAMDDDDMRHGLPSAHIAYGEANAILAGDSLHSLAFEVIANSLLYTGDTKLRMIQLLSHAAGWSGMAGGQCLDMIAEGRDLSLSELQVLHAAKTGALIRVAIQLGVLSAEHKHPSDEQFLLLSEFGDRIGLAFQVMDDVLDVTQSTETLGKPAGSDEANNKNTFPKLVGLEHARGMAQSLVDEALILLQRTRLETDALAHIARFVIHRDH